MRALALALLAIVPLTGCIASSSPTTSAEEHSTTSEDELSATKPIPYVLQYVGEYDGNGKGSFDWLVLRRTGTFVGSVDGVTKSGRFYGPKKPTDPLKITFVTRGEHPWTGVISGWATNATMVMTRNGATETVVSPWLNGNESMCDATGGAWADDDAAKATGLYCGCVAPKVYIPSLGGCVR